MSGIGTSNGSHRSCGRNEVDGIGLMRVRMIASPPYVAPSVGGWDQCGMSYVWGSTVHR